MIYINIRLLYRFFKTQLIICTFILEANFTPLPILVKPVTPLIANYSRGLRQFELLSRAETDL